ncbi:MAG: hypothetical protein ACRDQA_09755 [Nocardioidaceae bacterium]
MPEPGNLPVRELLSVAVWHLPTEEGLDPGGTGPVLVAGERQDTRTAVVDGDEGI